MSIITTENKLKPCPFCGKGAVKFTAKKGGKTMKFAGCMNELCSAERWKLPIGQWNNRAIEKNLREARRLIGFMTNEKIAEASRILDSLMEGQNSI